MRTRIKIREAMVVGGEGEYNMALDGDARIISTCGGGNVLYYTRLCTTVLIMKSIDQAYQ